MLDWPLYFHTLLSLNLLLVRRRRYSRCERYRNEGPSGLVSRRRGKRPNNSFSTEFRATVISLLKGRYADFGPTLACEKLREIHGLCLSIETLRKWMVEEGIWRERRRKFARIYQRRMRRPSYGELIQIDGLPHDWFEGRGSKCTLIVFIDDATSALMALRFAPAETTRAYMETLRGYLNDHGVPLALYSDIRLSRYAKALTVKLRFCMTGKRWDGKNMLMARSLYHWMMKKVSMNVWIMPVLIYAQNST
uniref:helix-turn-helix domain-containing protein n=1 Tax=Lelliottia wanjuensis TaxID=3050585 RepID=UPI003306EF48